MARSSGLPKPIRYDADTWLVMRSDPVLPKAVIQRVHHREGDRYLLIKWDLDPTKRELMNVCATLDRANELVLFNNEKPEGPWSMPYAYPDYRTPAQRLHDRDKQLGKERERGH